MIEANIDYLVLGCSHYPYLIPQIKNPNHIQIIDSGRAVAKQTQNILKGAIGLSSTTSNEATFYTNTNPST
jgi:glutamate racemase